MNFQLDTFFFDFAEAMRQWSSLLISFMSIMVCDISVILSRKYFERVGLCCCMIVFSILGNIQVLYATSYEIINFPVLLGTVTLSGSFLACDLINEHYGKDKAKKSIYLSFFFQLLFFVNIIMTIGHKPIDLSAFPDFSMTQQEVTGNISAIEHVFLPIPRLLIASYVAYLTSQLCEVWAYRATKKMHFIKSDCLKHNLALFFSSVVIDTFLFTSIALILLAREPLSISSFWNICISSWIIRIVCNFINSIAFKFDRYHSSNI